MPKESGWTITAYCGCNSCCGKEDLKSASGKVLSNLDAYRVCAAPSTFKFNTLIKISGGWVGNVTVVDRGGAIQGKRIDVFVGDKSKHQEALKFGKKVNCTVDYD